MLLLSFGTLIRLLLSIYLYACDVKTALICLYHFLIAKSNLYFTFSDLCHQKTWFPNTLEPPYNTVRYNTNLDITRMSVGPQFFPNLPFFISLERKYVFQTC